MAEQEFYFHTEYINKKENLAFWLSIPCICLLMVYFFGQPGNLLFQFALAAILATAISAASVFLLRSLHTWHKFKSLSQRIITHGIAVFVLAVLTSIVFTSISAGALNINFTEALKLTAATAFLSGLINAFMASVHFGRLWQKNILFTEALKREIMHTQLEGIRQQLSPHFFFNSLNSLSLIIQEDSTEAVKYVQHIAHMYRYLLQSKDTKAVPLQHELRFAESYIYLQKMRFGKALDMTMAIDKLEMQTLIPPLTLYILLENALKHNIITKAKPLHINVFIRDGKLQISNNIQARHLPDENPVIGLKTVRSSYESISGQPLQVIQDDKNFTVALPLIKELSQTA